MTRRRIVPQRRFYAPRTRTRDDSWPRREGGSIPVKRATCPRAYGPPLVSCAAGDSSLTCRSRWIASGRAAHGATGQTDHGDRERRAAHVDEERTTVQLRKRGRHHNRDPDLLSLGPAQSSDSDVPGCQGPDTPSRNVRTTEPSTSTITSMHPKTWFSAFEPLQPVVYSISVPSDDQ